MRVKSSRKPEATIPVAAMSDIAFLLIVFFMLTSEMSESGMVYNPPRQEQKTEETPVVPKELRIDKNDKISLNGQVMTPEQLHDALEREFGRARRDEEKVCTLRMDPASHYGVFFQVVDIVKDLGGYVTPKSQGDDEGAGAAVSVDASGTSKLEDMKNEDKDKGKDNHAN